MLAMTLLSVGTGLAQPGRFGGGPRPGGPGDGNPRERAIQRFEASAPEIGEQMPDLVIHDRTGEELRLRELLQGRFTVLVLGCLT